MRAATIVILLIALAGGGVYWLNHGNDVPTGPPLRLMAYPNARWGDPGPHHDLRYRVPEVFGEGIDHKQQRLLSAPFHNGFKPQWQSFRRPDKWGSLDGWTNHCLSQARAEFGDVLLERGAPDTVAGRPAGRIIIERVGKREDKSEVQLMVVQWCWLRGGHAYWLRGQAAARSFRSGHGALFEKIKSTVRHVWPSR